MCHDERLKIVNSKTKSLESWSCECGTTGVGTFTDFMKHLEFCPFILMGRNKEVINGVVFHGSMTYDPRQILKFPEGDIPVFKDKRVPIEHNEQWPLWAIFTIWFVVFLVSMFSIIGMLHTVVTIMEW